MRLLWVTSCADDMWKASGHKLVDSFLQTETEGDLLVCLEYSQEVRDQVPRASNLHVYNLASDPWMLNWLKDNSDVIPTHLGGQHDGICRCPRGPLGIHAKNHRQPCIGYWFNRNASRWFRKIASVRYAAKSGFSPKGFSAIVWLDSDCVFTRRTTQAHVLNWFSRDRACFYLKNKRPVIEAGVVGYNLAAGGSRLIDSLCQRYESKRYRRDPRWDDCYQLQMALRTSGVRSIDIAHSVGQRAAVVEHSLVGPFITHAKGVHGRGLGIMT